ncbi:MAG: heterocyst frequency control protein PatD [Synechococcales cyanobacterium RU_4_20]|nr:heterocyst frequency control protein PatD [Synechococcales cyanobacterium RU_4_20]NJR70127.1 heterocyst frequency control protein PatD [Synechococcales cyanobacterium CRU_2_2]
MCKFSLPKNYSQTLQSFEAQLATIAAMLWADSVDQLATQAQTLQQYFQHHIQPLDAEQLPTEQRSRFRSVQTELHRQMRLLQTDLLFLRNAHQADTASQRQQQVGDRLVSLRNYCAVLRQESGEESP